MNTTANEMVRGSKYSKNLGLADVASAIRADIKQAQKSGALARGLKVSITSSRKGTRSIKIVVASAPFKVYLDNPVMPATRDIPPVTLTPEAMATIDTLRALALQYQRDNSDAARDHFDCSFYESVCFA